MNAPTPYPSLFSAFTLGTRTLRNRIVHASMNTHMAAEMRVTTQLIDYHAARARGGAALIVTEPISMARHQHVSYRARASAELMEAALRWLAGPTRARGFGAPEFFRGPAIPRRR